MTEQQKLYPAHEHIKRVADYCEQETCTINTSIFRNAHAEFQSVLTQLEGFMQNVVVLEDGAEGQDKDIILNTAGSPEVWRNYMYLDGENLTKMTWHKNYKIIQRAGKPVIYRNKLGAKQHG